MRYKALSIIIGLSFISGLLLTSCGGEEEEGGCNNRLNQREYTSVAEDLTCNNYYRASAYLGLAGFTFASFMTSDAAENFSAAMGVGAGDDWKTTIIPNYEKAQCLVGSDKIVNSSTCEDFEVGVSKRDVEVERLNIETEISLFALLGELIVQMYGSIDADRQGGISDEEIENFTGFSESNDGSFEQQLFQFIISSNNVWLANVSGGSLDACEQTVGSGNYTAVHTGTTGNTNCSNLLSGLTGSTKVYPIIKVASMPQYFPDGFDVTAPLTLISLITEKAGEMDSDLESLGFNEDSVVRSNISATIGKIDNGGCSDTTVTSMKTIGGIVATAAKTSADNTASSNLIGLDTISSLDSSFDSSSLSSITVGTTTITVDNARFVYQKDDGSYTDGYSEASSGVSTSFTQLATLLLVDDGSGGKKVAESTKGDNEVTFEELMCYTP